MEASDARNGRSKVVIFSLMLGALGCQKDATSVQQGTPPTEIVAAARLSATAACPACIFGPRLYTRGRGEPTTMVLVFPATAGASYILDLDDLGSQGADGSVSLNGTILLAPRTLSDVGPRRYREAVALGATNRLEVRLTGRPGSVLQVALLGGVQTVGAAGGTVIAHGGGARLRIPAGALTSAVDISVLVADDPTAATTNQKKRVTLLPEGTTFASPVALTVTMPGVLRPSAGLFLKEGSWLRWWQTDVDVAISTLSIETTHFSTWVGLDGSTYSPGTYRVGYVSGAPSAPRASTGMELTNAELADELASALAQWKSPMADYGIGFSIASGLPEIEVAFAPRALSEYGQVYMWDQTVPVTDGRNPRDLRRIEVNSLLPWEGLNDPGIRDPSRTAPILVTLLAHELGHAFGLKHAGLSGDETLMGQGGFNRDPLALGQLERLAVEVNYGLVPSAPPQKYREAVRLEAVSATSLIGSAGAPVSERPMVRAVNAQGNPVSGVPVYFRTDGAVTGTINATAGVTGADGTFTLGEWRLASASAPQDVRARAHLPAKAAAPDEAVVFTATAATAPTCPLAAVPANATVHLCFTATLQPGTWHGWIIERSLAQSAGLVFDRARLNRSYYLASPSNFVRWGTTDPLAPPASLGQNVFAIQPEFNGTEWFDVARFHASAGGSALSLPVVVYSVPRAFLGRWRSTRSSTYQDQFCTAVGTTTHSFSIELMADGTFESVLESDSPAPQSNCTSLRRVLTRRGTWRVRAPLTLGPQGGCDDNEVWGRTDDGSVVMGDVTFASVSTWWNGAVLVSDLRVPEEEVEGAIPIAYRPAPVDKFHASSRGMALGCASRQ